MRILVIGATGTIGRAVVEALEGEHEIVPVSRHGSGITADLSKPETIHAMYGRVGKVDAVISAAGNAAWKPLAQLTDEDYDLSLRDKLMGQINLVRYGIDSVRDGGSFTLTSGVLGRRPAPGSGALAPVNAGLEAFARAAALELPRGIRINVVSPPWVSETLAAMKMDPSHGLPAATVARSYVESATGGATGQIFDPQ